MAEKTDWSVLDFLQKIAAVVLVGFGVVLILGALASFCLVPLVYDTIHLQDTLFFAELGWRVLNGAVPTVDFNHFYGGVVAQYVAWAFAWFGVTVKSVDYAFVMMAATAMGLAVLVSLRRLTILSFVALSTIVVASCLARVPFEELTAIQRPTSGHSFVYNRFASALAVILAVFALIPVPVRGLDALAGIACGVAAYLIVLIKPTFVPFLPAFLLALILLKRWVALGAVAIGLLLSVVLIDPIGARVLAAFDYAVASAGIRVSTGDLMLKTVAVFLVQPMSLLFVLLALIVTARIGGRRSIAFVIAAFGLTVGFAGMTATMGWRGSIGQQALPFLSGICIVFFEWARRQAPAKSGPVGFLHLTSLCVVMSFSLPQLGQSVLGGLVGNLRQPLLLLQGTPLETYLAWSDEFVTLSGGQIRAPMALDDQVASAKAHLEAGKKINVGVEYAMIADGVRLLQQVPNIQSMGLGGDYGVFSFAMQTDSVLGYPVWVATNSPELAPGLPLPEGLDVMMIRRVNANEMSFQLLEKMENIFVPCASSTLWTMYLRTGLDTGFCQSING